MSEPPIPPFRRHWESELPAPRPPLPPPWPPWVPAVFLTLTVITTLLCGVLYQAEFGTIQADDFSALLASPWTRFSLLLYGLPFCVSVLGILIAHELGHYLTCRRYGIDSTLPYVLPAPPLIPIPPPLAVLLGAGGWHWALTWFNPFGTFGAVIRIRAPFRDRRQLFDVGVAGPLAGFVLILPILVLAMSWSKQFDQLPEGGWLFGEPLLFQAALWLFYPGTDPARIMLHPIGWAAWFGMLATSLNLMPIGQLDGGHIVYALFGKRVHHWVSRLTFLGLVALSFASWPPFIGYTIFGLLGLLLGRRHPPTLYDREAPRGARIWIALLALLILVLTFIPVPLRPA